MAGGFITFVVYKKFNKVNINAGKQVRKTSILDIGPVIFADIEVHIGWFQRKRLLPRIRTA